MDIWGTFIVAMLFSIPTGIAQTITASWMEERLFLRARCKAKCLRLFQNPREQVLFKMTWHQFAKPPAIFDSCFTNDSEHCSSNCFTACDRIPEQCTASCTESGIGCHIGCHFLLDSLNPRPGSCPVPQDSSPLDQNGTVETAKCLHLCQSDSDCFNPLQKCCSVDCKHVCIETHQLGAKLDAFERGKIYQFRLAAVSPHGSRGFGPPSEPYPSDPIRPNPPGPPRNLTDSMWRFYSTGNINVLLSWAVPEQSDLSVSGYIINWVIDHGYVHPGGESLEGLTKFTQSVSSKQNQYVLPNLKPATSYKVQVRAIAIWHGYGPIESQPNTIFISTQAVLPVFSPQANLDQRATGASLIQSEKRSFNSSSCDCHVNNAPRKSFSVRKIFYENEELVATLAIHSLQPGVTYILEWAPQVCINPREGETVSMRQKLLMKEKTRLILLRNLRFSCRYIVRMHALISDSTIVSAASWSNRQPMETSSDDSQHKGEETMMDCFCTPSCVDVKVSRGPSPQNCSLPDPGPPPSPRHLIVTQLDKMNYRVSWQHPPEWKVNATRSGRLRRQRAPLDNQSLVKYRITWAPRVDEPVSKEMYNDAVGFSPIMDLQQSDARIVDQNRTWLDLHNLVEDTFYIVRVQTLSIMDGYSLARESSPAALYFVTKSQRRKSTIGRPAKHTGRSDANRISPRPFLLYIICINFISYRLYQT